MARPCREIATFLLKYHHVFCLGEPFGPENSARGPFKALAQRIPNIDLVWDGSNEHRQ